MSFDKLTYIIGFEGYIFALLAILLNNERLLNLRRYLLIISLAIGTVFTYITICNSESISSNEEAFRYISIFIWGIFIIFFIVFLTGLTQIGKYKYEKIADIPAGEYTFSSVSVNIMAVRPEFIWVLEYNNNQYTITTPLSGNKSDIVLYKYNNSYFAFKKNGFGLSFMQLIYIIYILIIPFICAFKNNEVATVYGFISILFGSSMFFMSNPKGLFLNILHKFSYFIFFAMVFAVFTS